MSAPVLLDAMGGDQAPDVPVRGALLARERGVPVTLVGNREVVRAALVRAGASPDEPPVLHAERGFAMDEHATEALGTTDTSLHVALRELQRGGGAFVSAGNSGAIGVAAYFQLGCVTGVDRPAIASVFPVRHGRATILDIGANADCRPIFLLQFAIMGSAYAELLLGVTRPRVGLLSLGEERGKGNRLVKAADRLLADSSLRYVGNVEPKDLLLNDACDVAVCDGFTGNIMIKTGEAVTELLIAYLRAEIGAAWHYRLAAGVARPALRRAFGRLDYREYGGAPLLGVRGNVVIAHGRSDALAIQNALLVGQSMIANDLWQEIERRVAVLTPATEPGAEE